MAAAAQLLPLTSLRFFAAIGVVLYHTYHPFLPSRPLPAIADHAIAVGFLGVSFFFVLSGFILAYNYLPPPGAGASTAMRGDARSFFVARFARIYPLYLLGLVIHAPFMASYRFAHDPNDAVALGKLLTTFAVNAGLLEGWLQFMRGGWNPPGWSLCAEALFYALFPLLAPMLWRSRHRDRTLLALLYLALLIVLTVAAILLHTGRLQPHENFSLEQFPLVRVPEFLFGIVLARSYRRGGVRSSWLWVAGALILSAAVAVRAWIPEVLLQNGILMPAFALIILGMSGGGGLVQRIMSHKTLVLLGEASYGIYILHVPLAWWFAWLGHGDARLSEIPPQFAVDQPFYYAIYLTVLIGLSIVSLRWFEEPARRWIRGLDGRIRARGEAVPAEELVQAR